MDYVIIVNKEIYKKYKDEVIMLTPRLFAEPYFYSLDSYKDPIDLTGIKNYLCYTDKIDIMASTSFLDFINVLLILHFLKENSYEGKINVNYYFTNAANLKKALFSKCELDKNDMETSSALLMQIKENKEIKNVKLSLPGIINFINFFNLMNDKDSFEFMIEDVAEEDDLNEDIAIMLKDKYSNMGLNEEYFLKILNKYRN